MRAFPVKMCMHFLAFSGKCTHFLHFQENAHIFLKMHAKIAENRFSEIGLSPSKVFLSKDNQEYIASNSSLPALCCLHDGCLEGEPDVYTLI